MFRESTYCSYYVTIQSGFRVTNRILGERGFRFWGWILTRIGVRVGFGFEVRVSVLGAQTLHPNRTRPVAILSPI